MTNINEQTSSVRYPDCEVELLGVSANTYAIVGKVRRVLRRYLIDKAGLTHQDADVKVEEFTQEATSGDHDNVLITCHRWVTVS